MTIMASQKNPILAALRDDEQWDFDGYIADLDERIERQVEWLKDNPDLPALMGFTPEQTEQADKVLARLVRLA